MLELEDLSVEMARPIQQVVVTHEGEGSVHVTSNGLTGVDVVILLSMALGAFTEQLTPEEEEEIEEWLESD